VKYAAIFLLIFGFAGSVEARERRHEALFPPEVIAGQGGTNEYDFGVFRLFKSEPLWPTDALKDYPERYRLTYFGILRYRLQIRIDGRSNGTALLRATLVRDRRVIETQRREITATEFAVLRDAATSSGLWSIFPEFWVPEDSDDICVDGMEAVLERHTFSGYGYSRGNTSCTSPPGMSLLAERMVKMAQLETPTRWFPWSERIDR
jgi:hypothetical protein